MSEIPESMTVPEAIDRSAVTEWERSADVVVVGQGVAGACAALEAHRAGAEVLVIESASGGGGASAMSSGIFYLGGGTPVQEALGYEDDADEMYKFIYASMQPDNAQAARAFCDDSRDHFNWLEAQGVPFERTGYADKAVYLNTTECLFYTGNEKVWPYAEVARPAPRGHKVAGTGENAGAVAMAALLERCNEEGVPAVYDTRVTGLVTENGRVVGLRARQSGREFYIEARRGVILTTGGYTLNRELITHYQPLLSETTEPLGIPSNDGAGMLLGKSVGGAAIGLDGIIATGSIYPPAQLIKGIIVNKNGERFVGEDVYHGRLAHFIMEQPEQTAYLIVDSEVFAYPEMTAHNHELVGGFESVEEMETELKLPAGSLQRTLDEYNADVRQGSDRRFYKAAEWLKPLDEAPYAAFDISFNRSMYYYLSLGGLRTDRNSQVLNQTGDPIPGLYAAGACAAHIPLTGKSYASGMSLGPGSYFGRVAGRHAATANARLEPAGAA